MKKLIAFFVVAAMAVATGSAEGVVTFDFQGATVGGAAPDYVASANQRVTDYMTAVYGSSVTATGAAAWRNSESGDDWPGKTDTDRWLRTYGSKSLTPGSFQISFDVVPIIGTTGDFYVFVEATQGDDFTVKAYDSTYGDRYNPNLSAKVGSYSYDGGIGADNFAMSFGSPVSLLVFSDSGWYDIAIDELQVSPIPAPGAILLGSMGVGLVGWLRRRMM